MKIQQPSSSNLNNSVISIIEIFFKLITIDVLLNFKKISKGIIFILLSLSLSILAWADILTIFSRYLLSIGIENTLATSIIILINIVVLIFFAVLGCRQFNTIKFNYLSNALNKLKDNTEK